MYSFPLTTVKKRELPLKGYIYSQRSFDMHKGIHKTRYHLKFVTFFGISTVFKRLADLREI